MAIRQFGLAAVSALGGLVACASIAGLDSSDPVTTGPNGTTPQGDVDGGTIVTEAGISISPQTIEIKDVPCGDSKSAPITITNVGTAPAPFSITVPDNSAFSLEGADGGTLTGEVPAKDSRIVQLSGKSDAPGNESADIVVKAGDTVQQISASLVTRGAGLVITPTMLDFGEIRKDVDSTPASVVFQNTGNDPITIAAFTEAKGFETPVNLSIPGGQQVTGTFLMQAGPKDDNPVNVTVTPKFASSPTKLCGPTPTIMLAGQRTDQNVIVNPPTLDFGRVGCGGVSAVKPKLTMTNFAPKNVHYVITLPSGSHFKGEQALEGDIAQAPDAKHPVTAEITFDQQTAEPTLKDLNEPLTVVLTGQDPAGSTLTKTVNLRTTAYGAVLQASTGGYGNIFYTYPDLVQIADGDTGYGSIKNVGNASVCVKYSVSGGNTGNFFPEADDRLDLNDLYDLRVTFDATTNGNYATTLNITHADCTSALGGGESAPFCQPPPTVAVTGYRNVQSSSSGSNGSCCHPH